MDDGRAVRFWRRSCRLTKSDLQTENDVVSEEIDFEYDDQFLACVVV
jgi:hypothetical protein